LYRAAFAVLVSLAGCGGGNNVVDEVGVRIVTFPNGGKVRAEVMINQDDLMRGMMYRDSLPAGRGMLFIHPKPAPQTYWMFRVRIPLDIVFMDANQRIVYIEVNAPPCEKEAKDCPQYGPKPPRPVQYVLELGGGQASRYGLKTGDLLRF
jgi:uncharacterized membrane protein (UPF0127 family)